MLQLGNITIGKLEVVSKTNIDQKELKKESNCSTPSIVSENILWPTQEKYITNNSIKTTIGNEPDITLRQRSEKFLISRMIASTNIGLRDAVIQGQISQVDLPPILYQIVTLVRSSKVITVKTIRICRSRSPFSDAIQNFSLNSFSTSIKIMQTIQVTFVMLGDIQSMLAVGNVYSGFQQYQ